MCSFHKSKNLICVCTCATEPATSPSSLAIDVGRKQSPLGLMGLGEAGRQAVCLCLMRPFLVGLDVEASQSGWQIWPVKMGNKDAKTGNKAASISTGPR